MSRGPREFYMQTEVEAGHGCPITMTFAATPSLRLAARPRRANGCRRSIRASTIPQHAPVAEKHGATIGMAMTEKQGGSDVRANTTRGRRPIGDGLYEITGHKFFVSAPMCDAFLVLAQTPAGLTCFLAPRWRPDGTKNPHRVRPAEAQDGQRLQRLERDGMARRARLAGRAGGQGRRRRSSRWWR